MSSQAPARQSASPFPIIYATDNAGNWGLISTYFTNYPEFVLLGCALSMKEVVAHGDQHWPAIILSEPPFVDLHTNEIQELSIRAKANLVVLITGVQRGENYLRIGAMGILPRDSPPDVYRQAVLAVSRGEIWARRSVISSVFRELWLLSSPHALTSREMAVLELISAGHNNREIAARLSITRETVRWHVRNLYSKLGVSNRQGATALASLLKTSSTP